MGQHTYNTIARTSYSLVWFICVRECAMNHFYFLAQVTGSMEVNDKVSSVEWKGINEGGLF